MSSSFDFQGSDSQRSKFVDWIEGMDEEEYQDRLRSSHEEGGFTDAQKNFAEQIREEQKGEEEPEPTPTEGKEKLGPPSPKSPVAHRQGVIKRLRAFFGFQN